MFSFNRTKSILKSKRTNCVLIIVGASARSINENEIRVQLSKTKKKRKITFTFSLFIEFSPHTNMNKYNYFKFILLVLPASVICLCFCVLFSMEYASIDLPCYSLFWNDVSTFVSLFRLRICLRCLAIGRKIRSPYRTKYK